MPGVDDFAGMKNHLTLLPIIGGSCFVVVFDSIIGDFNR